MRTPARITRRRQAMQTANHRESLMRTFSASVVRPYAQVEQHEASEEREEAGACMCTRVCVAKDERTRNAERERKKRESEEGKREEKETHTRACMHARVHARTRPHSRALASVERPLTLHFVVGVFLCVLLPLFFSTLSTLPPALGPHTPSPFLTLDAPGKKKHSRAFFALLFLHDSAICRPA